MRFLIDKNTGETCLNFNDEDLETIKKNNNTLIFDKEILWNVKIVALR